MNGHGSPGGESRTVFTPPRSTKPNPLNVEQIRTPLWVKMNKGTAYALTVEI